MSKKNIQCILLITILFFTRESYGYQKTTHKIINTSTTNLAVVDGQLKSQLNFQPGINTDIKGMKIVEWLGQGGEKEDEPLWRPRNHFHDPLKDWDSAGLNLATSESAVIWAQNIGNDWSWPAARDYFYQALTASSAAEREQGFADTFRALGQIMHLVEDMSNRLSAVSSQLSAEGVPA